jgi:hypothetical protein
MMHALDRWPTTGGDAVPVLQYSAPGEKKIIEQIPH